MTVFMCGWGSKGLLCLFDQIDFSILTFHMAFRVRFIQTDNASQLNSVQTQLNSRNNKHRAYGKLSWTASASMKLRHYAFLYIGLSGVGWFLDDLFASMRSLSSFCYKSRLNNIVRAIKLNLYTCTHIFAYGICIGQQLCPYTYSYWGPLCICISGSVHGNW